MIHFSLRKQLGQLNLHAEAGFTDERIVISGENGSGKTTLLRLIAGLERADQGHIGFFDYCWFDSDRGHCLPAHKRKATCLFTYASLLPWLSVADNICIGLTPEQRSGSDGAMRELLRTLKLDGLMTKAATHLSAGEAQRVAMARALISLPRLILLDEPFSAQSPKMRSYLQQWLVELHNALRFPLILVTHDKAEATLLGERHWHMSNGKLITIERGLQKPQRGENHYE
ncbi:MAG: hypothetical protein CO187_05110 [Zetaproteobacteria bacterium CG_4_9_14_3_um_filter_53_7]|nr:MAG: hypothetical protein CO187_05110 [Zetaproteobacteria bacterium CG_4_9_14_3_um_filter_53_7]